MNEIKNGDIWDIGQTVNGQFRFLYLNNKWYYTQYVRPKVVRNDVDGKLAQNGTELIEYEYDSDDLSKLITNDYDNETRLLGNIFTDEIELDIKNCDLVIQSIREFKLNKIL